MHVRVTPREVVRRVFPTWSISIPASLDETFIHEDGYWHAWDAHRSVSLSSVVMTDEEDRPVTAELLVERLTPPTGKPVHAMPPGLIGWAVETDTRPPAVASRALAGMLAIEGCILVATITSDDREWALRTWSSIRCHPAGFRGSPSVLVRH